MLIQAATSQSIIRLPIYTKRLKTYSIVCSATRRIRVRTRSTSLPLVRHFISPPWLLPYPRVPFSAHAAAHGRTTSQNEPAIPVPTRCARSAARSLLLRRGCCKPLWLCARHMAHQVTRLHPGLRQELFPHNQVLCPLPDPLLHRPLVLFPSTNPRSTRSALSYLIPLSKHSFQRLFSAFQRTRQMYFCARSTLFTVRHHQHPSLSHSPLKYLPQSLRALVFNPPARPSSHSILPSHPWELRHLHPLLHPLWCVLANVFTRRHGLHVSDSQRKPLAQPIGLLWRGEAATAQNAAVASRSVKVTQRDILQRQKKTVTFKIWHTVQ